MGKVPADPSPQRHYPAHPTPVQRHNEPTIVLVTACILDRHPVLANDRVHVALRTVWPQARNWMVGYYMIMPDHVHLFCAPAEFRIEQIKTWAKYWKALLSKRAPELRAAWQPDCWDTQMRSSTHYLRKLEYVRENPVRAGLVARSEDWPYQGIMNELRW